LPKLEDRLLAGDDVAAIARDEHILGESQADEVFFRTRPFKDSIYVRWGGRHRSWIESMV